MSPAGDIDWLASVVITKNKGEQKKEEVMETSFLYNYQKIHEKSMNRYRLTLLWTISIFLTFTLICISEPSTAKNNDSMLILTEQTNITKQNTQNLNLSLRMIETSAGITMSVHFKENKKQKQAIGNQTQLGPDLISGGEIKLFIDDNLLVQTYFNTGKVELDHPVNIELLENGNHTAKCEINTVSGEHFSQTVPFAIDASPRITIIPPMDKQGVFDPEIKVHFFGGTDDFVGMLEISLDAQLVHQVPVGIKRNNKPLPLSHFIGDRFDMVRLPQGEHLLKVSATGINGSSAVSYTPFAVDTTPTMSLLRDKKGNFKKLSINFSKSNQGVSGSFEVYLKQNMILARQVREDSAILTRGELKQVLEKYNTSSVKHKMVTIIVAARSANGVEKWTAVDFK